MDQLTTWGWIRMRIQGEIFEDLWRLAAPTRHVTPGKHTKNYGKSPFGIGKSTVNEPFSIAMLNYQKVNILDTSDILSRHPGVETWIRIAGQNCFEVKFSGHFLSFDDLVDRIDSKEYGRAHGTPSVISHHFSSLNGFIDLADLEFAVRFHITHSPSEDY